MKDFKQHWETIYSKRKDEEVSWYQEYPGISILLVEKYSSNNKNKTIIDVGGGTSILIAELVRKSYTNLSVLDISGKAIERNRKRIPIAQVKWIERDILEYESIPAIDIWHDRAVFHFLTDEKDINRYVVIVKKSIVKDGFLILSTFSEKGPVKCSGLPTTQYSEEKFCKLFEPEFQLMECFEEVHKTPFGTRQDFIWAVFRHK